MSAAPRPAILLVDDEPAYTALIASTLSQAFDVDVVPFTRPQAALDALPGLEVGLMVTDYFMPQMNGLQFLRKAVALKPGAPCLLITGHHTASLDAADAGVTELREVIAKPLSPTALAAAVRRHWPTIPAHAPGGPLAS